MVIAGPCSVESRDQIIETACAVKECGAAALRGGAFKPRTSPYSFPGYGEEALQWLAEARERTGLPIVTEVMDTGLVPLVCQYADVLQIGARNMQNFALLHAAGASQHPILVARHEQHRRGAVNGGGVYPVAWQQPCHAVRAGHPHF
jgi:3-deoxy-7-phosphoheptulonate synthase